MGIYAIAWIGLIAALATSVGCAVHHNPAAAETVARAPIPVILDTDIGDDIDDTWALTMLLKSPQFDVKLITTTHGQSDYRARLIGKILTIANRTDIPIGLGAGESSGKERIARWVTDFPLNEFRGKIFQDGVQAIIDAVHRSPQPITIIAIGPLDTLAAALARNPSIAANANLVGMQGSVYKGYPGSHGPAAEFNVKSNVPAAQKVLSAPWQSIAITPLDTCGDPQNKLTGDEFAAVKAASGDPRVRAILESYAIWNKTPDPDLLTESTILYDTVAIYLADPDCQRLLDLQTLKIVVTDDGMTAVSPNGTAMKVATSWKDLAAYRTHLVDVLLSR